MAGIVVGVIGGGVHKVRHPQVSKSRGCYVRAVWRASSSQATDKMSLAVGGAHGRSSLGLGPSGYGDKARKEHISISGQKTPLEPLTVTP